MFATLFMLAARAVEPTGPLAVPAPFEAPTDEIVSGLIAHESELLAAAEDQDPRHYHRLIALRDVDRAAYVAGLYKVSKLVERLRSDPAFAERMRQIGAREDQLRTMAAGFGSKSAAEQQVLRAQMVAVATELMELKQAERRQRLEDMRARLDHLEREIEQRELDRQVIVEEYVEKLVLR